MFIDNIKRFIESGDFDTFWTWWKSVYISDLIVMPEVFIPLIILVGILAHPQTTYLGTRLLMWIPALTWIGLTLVILKNDSISSIGPFILALVSFLMIVGFLIYSQLLAND